MTWTVGDGPAIRLVRAQQERLRRLVIAVRSLEQAREFLRANNLLGSESSAGLTVRDLDFLQIQQ
jgi:hypothetical protein